MESNIYKEYTYNEWINLDPQTKGKIMNQYWSPYEPNKGLFTKNEIINEFKKTHKEKLDKILAIGFGYFGWEVLCLYIIVNDSEISIPSHFADIYVNKGIVQERIDSKIIVVKWRYGGSKNLCEINDDLTFKSLGLYKWREKKNIK